MIIHMIGQGHIDPVWMWPWQAGADEALRLVPIRALNLEQALGFIDHDELVEITPTSMRLRKKILSASRRPKKVME